MELIPEALSNLDDRELTLYQLQELIAKMVNMMQLFILMVLIMIKMK